MGNENVLERAEPGVFVNYRRTDTDWAAGRLYQYLGERLERDYIFLDEETIPPGVNFQTAVDRALATSHTMPVLIGQSWISELCNRRSKAPGITDHVVLEIKRGFDRKMCILPVLIDGAVMPTTQDLPPQIAELAHVQAVRLNSGRFQYEANQVVQVVMDATRDAAERGDRRARRALRASQRWPRWWRRFRSD